MNERTMSVRMPMPERSAGEKKEGREEDECGMNDILFVKKKMCLFLFVDRRRPCVSCMQPSAELGV